MLAVYRQCQLLRLFLGELTHMSQHFFEFEIIELGTRLIRYALFLLKL